MTFYTFIYLVVLIINLYLAMKLTEEQKMAPEDTMLCAAMSFVPVLDVVVLVALLVIMLYYKLKK